MIFTPKQIDEIAQEIEAGMKAYINLKTHEIKTIFDWEDSFGDTEEWEEEQEAIEKEWTNFAVITKMESRESYRVMENFVKEIHDVDLQQKLVRVLERKRPFAHFKEVVESSAYRKNWFDFRFCAAKDYVKKQLESEGFKIDDGSTSL
jgi:Uncharacterised protein family (UPF0158)